MKIFRCDNCQQPLFFENRSCYSCGNLVAYHDLHQRMVSFPETGSEAPVLCKNYEHKACNWIVTDAQANGFCNACALNRTIPNLGDTENSEKWRRLEAAKHRLIYQLQRFQLPLQSKMQYEDTGLCFDFLVRGNSSIMTGHASGVITILLAEADSVHLERVRKQLLEPYRTLIGHFRHEVGHYFWERLVWQDSDILESYRNLFGDEQANYQDSLNGYYQHGATKNWREKFISKYASVHPWEDWAETWAHYLHIVDTVETAYNFGIGIEPVLENADHMKTHIVSDPYINRDFDQLIESSAPLFFAVNSINRSMGIKDVYPFVHNIEVIQKMKFIHELLSKSLA